MWGSVNKFLQPVRWGLLDLMLACPPPPSFLLLSCFRLPSFLPRYFFPSFLLSCFLLLSCFRFPSFLPPSFLLPSSFFLSLLPSFLHSCFRPSSFLPSFPPSYLPSFLWRAPTANFRSQCSPPDANNSLSINVFLARSPLRATDSTAASGPPLQTPDPRRTLTEVPDQSLFGRTSTASSGAECSPLLDIWRKIRGLLQKNVRTLDWDWYRSV